MRLLRTLWCLTLLAGCRPDDGAVTVGVILDREGEIAARLAAEDINAAGGVNGRPLELRVLSEGGESGHNAISAADAMSADPAVLAVVGHGHSAATMTGAQIYNSRKVVQIAPTSTSPVFSRAGPYSFRLVASDHHQATFLAHLAAAEGSLRPSVVYVNDDYGREIYATLVARLRERGITPALESPYLPGAEFRDLELLIRDIEESSGDLLIWLGREPELRRLLPQLRRVRPDIKILASDGLSSPRLKEPGGELLVGVRYVRLLDPLLDSPTVRQVRERVSSERGAEASDQALLAYEAVQLLARAIDQAGPDRERIREFLTGVGSASPPFRGITGEVAFDAERGVKRPYFLMEVTPAGSRLVAGPSVAAR